MIRRWSYINSFNFFFKEKIFFSFKKLGKIKVFKATLSAKRFTKKYTKFRRKAFNRLRHQTNSLIYTNLFKFWAKDFLVTKNIIRHQLSFNLYAHNFFFFDWSSCINKNPNIFFNSFFFFVNNFKNKKHFQTNYLFNIFSYKNFDKYYRSSALGSVENLELISLFENNVDGFHNGLIYRDGSFFFEINPDLNKKLLLNFFENFNDMILENLKIFYKVFILISLFNTLN